MTIFHWTVVSGIQVRNSALSLWTWTLDNWLYFFDVYYYYFLFQSNADPLISYDVSLSRMLNNILTLDKQWLPNWSDFLPIPWPWYRAWPSPNYEWFPWSIFNGCGIPAGNAYPSRHLVSPPFWDLLVLQLETKFTELAVSLLDFSPWLLLGTSSILIVWLRWRITTDGSCIPRDTFWNFDSNLNRATMTKIAKIFSLTFYWEFVQYILPLGDNRWHAVEDEWNIAHILNMSDQHIINKNKINRNI